MNTKDMVFRDVTIRILHRNLWAYRKQQISDAPTLLTITSSINGSYTKSVVAYTLEPKVSADHLRIEPTLVQGGSNMTGTDLRVNKPHCAAAVRP